MKYKVIIPLLVLVSLGLALFFVFRSESVQKTNNQEEKGVRSKKIERDGRSKRVRKGRKTARVSVKSVLKEKEKPTFDLEAEEEAKLTVEQRKLLEEIRKALDDDDKKTVLRLVQKLQKSDEWPDGIPKAIKMAAIEALGWFGSSCLPEIAGFLADADLDVIDAAVERYEEALSDFDLSDRERSAILIEASKVITNSEAMDMMLFELNNMRNSVAIETIKQLMVHGGKATQAVLPENIEFYTCEEGLNTQEKLDQWLQNNPDDPDDEEFYGGSSSSK